MAQFRVYGADKRTGETRTIIVEAASEADARAAGLAQGLYVGRVEAPSLYPALGFGAFPPEPPQDHEPAPRQASVPNAHPYPRPPRRSGTGDFLAFRRMLTPRLVEIGWILMAILWAGLAVASGIEMMRAGEAVLGTLVALFGSAAAFVVARISAEFLIVLFRINETLSDIRDALIR